MSEVIAIRVDANSDIGFGHLSRMKALAHELKKQGAEVIFLTRDPENIQGYEVLQLNIDLGPEEDLKMEEMLADINVGMLIIDSYEYKKKRLARVGQMGLLTVYIDDLNRHSFDTDFVVNGNLYAPRLDYQGKAYFLLGPKYLLLREEFCGIAKRVVTSRVRNVLLTFGAADMQNVTPGILQALKSYGRFESLHWHVVIGPVFRNTAEIEAVVKKGNNITLYYNPDLRKLMDLCEIGISAAGSTTYEMTVAGLASALVVVGNDQVMLAKEAELRGIAFNLGWFNCLDNTKLYSVLDELINNYELRKTMVSRGQELIDGRGAERVVTILLDEMRKRK